VIIGIKATIAIIPNPSTKTFALSKEFAIPCVNASIKVAVIGPVATPPASNAMPTNNLGEKNVSKIAIKYPGSR